MFHRLCDGSLNRNKTTKIAHVCFATMSKAARKRCFIEVNAYLLLRTLVVYINPQLHYLLSLSLCPKRGQLYSAECHQSLKTMTGLFITFNRDMVIGTQGMRLFKRIIGTPFTLLVAVLLAAIVDDVGVGLFRAMFSGHF